MHRNEKPASFDASPSKSSRCTFRTLQTTRCHTEVDEHGNHHRKCERVMKKFKECPGLPLEIVEQVESDVDPSDPIKGTSFSAEFGNAGSEFETVFSHMDKMLGIFDEKHHHHQESLHEDSKKSFGQKIGDYLSWQKDHESKMKSVHHDGHKKSSGWKQFESDFQEI